MKKLRNMLGRLRRLRAEAGDMIRYTVKDTVEFDRSMVAYGDEFHLCREFDEDGAPTARGLERANRFVRMARRWPEWMWRVYAWEETARVAWRCTVCAVRDHAYEDQSVIGPESGTEHIVCSRCGWSWSHTYY